MQRSRRMIGYEIPEEIAADYLFEAQGNVAEAQRLEIIKRGVGLQKALRKKTWPRPRYRPSTPSWRMGRSTRPAPKRRRHAGLTSTATE